MTHPMYTAPKGLSNLNSCPRCGREGYLSFESQELELVKDTLTITRSFYCDYIDCGDYYFQTIRVKLGEVLSNEVNEES